MTSSEESPLLSAYRQQQATTRTTGGSAPATLIFKSNSTNGNDLEGDCAARPKLPSLESRNNRRSSTPGVPRPNNGHSGLPPRHPGQHGRKAFAEELISAAAPLVPTQLSNVAALMNTRPTSALVYSLRVPVDELGRPVKADHVLEGPEAREHFNHAHAIAMAHEPEELGSAVLALKKERNGLQNDKTLLLVNKRRLEAALAKALGLRLGCDTNLPLDTHGGLDPVRAKMLKVLDDSRALEERLTAHGAAAQEWTREKKQMQALIEELNEELVRHKRAEDSLRAEVHYFRNQASVRSSVTIQQQQEELDSLRAKVAELLKELQLKSSDLERHLKTSSDLEARASVEAMSASELRKRLKAVEEELAAAKAYLEEGAQAREEGAKEADTLKTRLSKATRHAQALQQQLDTLQAGSVDTETMLQAQLMAANEAMTAAQRAVLEAQAQIASLRAENEAMKATQEKLTAENEGLRADAGSQRGAAQAELETRLQTLEARCQALEAERDALLLQLDEAASAASAAAASAALASQEELDALTAKLQALEAQANTAAAMLAAMKDAEAEAQKCREAEAEALLLVEQARSAAQAYAAAAVEAASGAVMALEAQLAASRSQTTQAEAALAGAQSELAATTTEVEEARAKLAAAQSQLAAAQKMSTDSQTTLQTLQSAKEAEAAELKAKLTAAEAAAEAAKASALETSKAESDRLSAEVSRLQARIKELEQSVMAKDREIADLKVAAAKKGCLGC